MIDTGWDSARFDHDAALARLHDVLLGLPADRVLPALDDILDQAKMTSSQVADDSRVTDVLLAAARIRPWGTPHERAAVRTAVSLLELEVDVLAGRLTNLDLAADVLRDTSARLRELRDELDDLRRPL